MITNFANQIMENPSRQFIPIGVYGGLELTGASVFQAISNADIQTRAALALQEHLQLPTLLTAMDLSVEAEAFGCQIRFSEDEIPTVLGRRAQSMEDIQTLPIPPLGAGRTEVYLDTARQLVQAGKERGVYVLGGVIGPFSLAGRIFGVSEALELSATDPTVLETLLEKATKFLLDYILAFRATGVDGVIMAEPAAGLLSPRGLGRFSSRYVRQIVESSQSPDFAIILHNCAAKLVHLPKILESGAEIFHFGDPMDLPSALTAVNGQAILAGNLDPTSVFYSGNPENIREKCDSLLASVKGHPNFFLSSGCDIPPGTPLENIAAAVKSV